MMLAASQSPISVRFSAPDLPAYWSGWTTRWALRGLGPVGPDLVDRVAIDRDQFGAPACERFLRLLHPVARVKPGIIADASAFWRMLLEPLRGARLGDRLVAPFGRGDLLANLQRVAAVDEDRRFLGKDHSRTRRALEARQPGETLGIASDIFAHMLVGQRNDEAVELSAFNCSRSAFRRSA